MKEIFERINQYLLFLVLLVVVLYFGKPILIPLIFGALLSMLLAPICRKLDGWQFPRALSSLISVLIIVIVIAGVVTLIGHQFVSFAKDLPKIEEKAKALVTQGQQFIEKQFGVSSEKQEKIAKKQVNSQSVKGLGGSLISKIAGGIVSTIGGLVLTLVFTFLMIFNKEHFETFFIKLYRHQNKGEVKEIVSEIATVSQKYLTGRVLSILSNASLYAIGLSLVGIKNAILLACIAAMLTLIPYVGTVIGGVFPVLMALTTEDTLEPALWAAGVLFFIQTVDNYFIEPNIVGGEVDLSALTTIVVLILGGLVWGPAGMILFLPLTGIAKIVCDHIEELKPIGYLVGEQERKPSRIKLWLQKKLRKK